MWVNLQMALCPDDHACNLRVAIPAPRQAPDIKRVMADDRLIEDVRADRVSADSPPVARMLALWRRSVLACLSVPRGAP